MQQMGKLRLRRPQLIVLGCLVLLLVLWNGPPLLTLASKEQASGWVERINDEARSIYKHTIPVASSRFGFRQSTLVDATVYGENPKIRQATMLFDGGNDKRLRASYERALQTHLRHGERWGVPTHILRRMLLREKAGVCFNKLAYVLELMLPELDKRPGTGTEWIV